jgi:hypothetical protein
MHQALQQQHRHARLQQQQHQTHRANKRARTAIAVVAAATTTQPSSPAVLWQHTSNGSWVASPRGSAPPRRPPGVVHLLGGAFAGAAPQVAYARLAEALASPPRRRGSSSGNNNTNGGGGFTVITTPYRLTFDHLRSAERVRRDLRDAVEEVASSSSSDFAAGAASSACAAVLEGRCPLLAVGHSNGALLHALGACQQAEGGGQLSSSSYDPSLFLRPRAVVLVSYNNKAVGDAVPFGLLDRLRGALSPLPPAADGNENDDNNNNTGGGSNLFLLEELAEALSIPPRIARASPAVEQVATVAEEVRRGASDFDPPPQRTRELVTRLYPRDLSTLLVRFSDDNTDETPELARMLSDRQRVQAVVLPGNHLTPCGADDALLLQRRPPPVAAAAVRPFTPADALAMAAREWGRAARERDADRLADRVVAYLRAAAV